MARLTFSNVPTASGGIISGNISTGAGSPFGAGGKYEAQVSDIKETISQAPEGFYDPVGWDDFLKKEELYSEQLPEGVRFYGIDDPEVMDSLLDIPSARQAIEGFAQLRRTQLGHLDRVEYYKGITQERIKETLAKKKYYQEQIAFWVDQVLMEKNAPLIQVIEQQERQLEIDQAVKIALEQKIRETATPKPTPTPTAPAVISSFPIIPLIIIAVIVGIFFLRRRA